jgi:hypothetical protein
VRKAASLFISSGWAQLALDTALGEPGDRWCDDFQCLVHMDTLQGLLNKIRAAFGDFARLYYPWHPDDLARRWRSATPAPLPVRMLERTPPT